MPNSASRGVSKGWRWSTLEEECEILGGGTPKRSNPNYFGGGIPWATPTDVTGLDGLYICQTKETVTPEGIAASSTNLLPAGAVLLTSRATIGFTAIAEVPICTNQGFANFVCGENILPEYLAYWLPTQRDVMLREAGGTTFKEISKGALKKFKIPVPPLEEQRRIVDILKRADSIRRLRKQAIDTTRRLIPALFIDMFGDPATNPKGWPFVKAGSLMVSASYGTSKKANTDGNGIPVLRMGNVSPGGDLLLDDLKFVKLDDDEKRKQLLQKGDILFNRTNSKELVGKTGIWHGEWDAVAASYFIVVRLDRSKVVPEYFWAFMNSGYMKERLFETARGAIGQANINAKELRNFDVPLPPLDLQEEFLTRQGDIQSLNNQQKTAHKKSDEAFQSLLQRCFPVHTSTSHCA